MTTTEGNKLIAEFMGAYIAKEGQLAYDMDDKYPNGLDRLMPEDMKYHTSWDWLMPVVKECFNKQFFGSNFYIKGIILSLPYVELEMTWKAVVSFIELYSIQ